MTISSLTRKYFVIVKFSENEKFNIYISRNESELSNQFYTIIEITEDVLIKTTMPFFVELKKNEDFTDFKESFVSDGKFYIVFSYVYQTEDMYLENAISRMSLKERISIADNLLKKLFMQNPPAEILCETLRLDSIVAERDTTVHFNYFLDIFEKSETDVYKKSMLQLSHLILMIFYKEVYLDLSGNLNTFIESVGKGKYANVQEVYKAYSVLRNELLDLPDEPLIKRNKFLSWLEKIWEFIQSKYRPVLACIIIIVGLLYLYQTINATIPSDPKGSIKVIGNLEIEQDE